jgi:uncharacterized membrane protein YebE (DUF533 family)
MNTTLMKKALGMLALGSLGLMAGGAQADWNRPGHGGQVSQHRVFGQQIDARQERQRDRIQAGMRAGNLTRAEFRELKREQHAIRAMEQRFRADGVIDAREFRRLDHALDAACRYIKAEKHGRQAHYAGAAAPTAATENARRALPHCRYS